MAEMSGYGGGFTWTISDVTVSDADYNIYSWNLDLTCDVGETTNFADAGNRTYIRGLKGWAGSAETYVDGTNSFQPSDVGYSGVVKLYTERGDKYWFGTAFLTGVHPKVSVDAVPTQTIDFQGTSTLAYSDLA